MYPLVDLRLLAVCCFWSRKLFTHLIVGIDALYATLSRELYPKSFYRRAHPIVIKTKPGLSSSAVTGHCTAVHFATVRFATSLYPYFYAVGVQSLWFGYFSHWGLDFLRCGGFTLYALTVADLKRSNFNIHLTGLPTP